MNDNLGFSENSYSFPPKLINFITNRPALDNINSVFFVATEKKINAVKVSVIKVVDPFKIFQTPMRRQHFLTIKTFVVRCWRGHKIIFWWQSCFLLSLWLFFWLKMKAWICFERQSFFFEKLKKERISTEHYRSNVRRYKFHFRR